MTRRMIEVESGLVRQPVEGHLRLVSNVTRRRRCRLDGRVVHGRFLPLPHTEMSRFTLPKVAGLHPLILKDPNRREINSLEEQDRRTLQR